MGSTLRGYLRGEKTEVEYLAAVDAMSRFRAQFAGPLGKVNVGLRQFGVTLDLDDITVTQRLKREETIIEKLTQRETSMNLATMQDIGGCRVVVDTLGNLRRFEAHVRKRWGQSFAGEPYDYIEHPRPSGYRAVHIVVSRDNYPIEIQLRTKDQHLWAQTVESFNGLLGQNYKQEGDHDVQELMALISQMQQAAERGEEISTEKLREMRRLRDRVFELLAAEGR